MIIVTPVSLGDYLRSNNLDIRILREELYPFFGGGNKARKLSSIVKEIKSGSYNAVVTTGSVFSNHCRAVALMCVNNDLDLSLVLHGDKELFYKSKGNAQIIRETDSKIVFCKPEMIAQTMQEEMDYFTTRGKKTYYLPGGGHNKRGIEAYIDFTSELKEHFDRMNWMPEYIFLPSGTGSTQAGLILGTILNGLNWEIIGISIARDAKKGIDSITDAIGWFNFGFDNVMINFNDAYVAGGYGFYDDNILEISKNVLRTDSIFLDPVYTAKALWGTIDYIKKNSIEGRVLFLNTGGLFNFFC